MQTNPIDISFDFRSDTPEKKDPDTWSPTLCHYHADLWGKPLPDGRSFHLEKKPKPPFHLHHDSDLRAYWLSSDAVMASFGWSVRLFTPFDDFQRPAVPKEREEYLTSMPLAPGAEANAAGLQACRHLETVKPIRGKLRLRVEQN